MEFWGIEVKAGQTVKCNPGLDKYLHLSQASLGESKRDKGSTSIPLFVNVNNQKLVIGTLSPDKCAQISYDLVFEKEFELSHGWKDGSVFFIGYKTVIADEESDGGFSDTDSEDEQVPVLQKANGKPVAKEEPKAAVKSAQKQPSASTKGKPTEEPVKPKADESNDDDDDDDSGDSSDEEESGEDESDEEMGDSDEDDESSEEEEKVTPKKPEVTKKRPLDSDAKAPSDKKAKLSTPAKTDGKKTVHIATPHPAKQVAKTQGKEDKSKSVTPRAGMPFSCQVCSKGFTSDAGLQSHTKAKHSGGK